MKKVTFKDLAIGSEFVFNNETYVKINPEKVSCCKSLTAAAKEHPGRKIFVNPGVLVEVADES